MQHNTKIENIIDDDIIEANDDIMNEISRMDMLDNDSNISYEMITNKLKNKQNTHIDLTPEFNQMFEEAHEYGSDMEKMYNEPNEYTTSYHETIALSLIHLNEEIEKYDLSHIENIKLSSDVYDELLQHSKCECVKEEYDQFISKIGNAIITIV